MIDENRFYTTVYVREIGAAFVLINTAWSCDGGLSEDGEYGRILYPEAALRDTLKQIPKNATKILVGHHPIEWMAEFVQEDFRKVLSKNFDFYLSGHLHSVDPRQIQTVAGATVQNQVGALFTGRERLNSYSIINIDTVSNARMLEIRTYYDSREEFDRGVNITKDGMFFPTDKDRQIWIQGAKHVPKKDITSWIKSEVKKSLDPIFNDGISDKRLCDVFVEPPMRRAHLSEDVDTDSEEVLNEIVGFSEIKESSENFVIYSKQEYGKTTLLKQIGHCVLANQTDGDPILPVLIDFEEIKPGRDRFLRLIKSQLPDPLPSSLGVKDLLNDGYVLVLIDDVDFTNERKISVLREFIKKYPQNRFILSAEQRFLETLGVVAEFEAAVPFSHVCIESMGRRGLRSLVEKWE